MAAGKGWILVEGHGEVDAVANLIARMWRERGAPFPWMPPRRWLNLHQWQPRSGRGGVAGGAGFVRSKPAARALLILRDEDDGCPRERAPRVTRQLAGLGLPFPVAYVLLRPEYEVLFLPCLRELGFPEWDGATWESRRGIKEWLSSHLPPGRRYKPTLDQARYTRGLDLGRLRAADVPSFGTLERALDFLADPERSVPGAVYPPPSP